MSPNPLLNRLTHNYTSILKCFEDGIMTDYMLLMRNEGNPMANVTDEERNASMAEWGTWMGGLQEQGKLRAYFPLTLKLLLRLQK